MIKIKREYLFAALAALFWGCIGIFTKALSAIGFSTAELSLLRSIVPALVIFVYSLLFSRSTLYFRLQDFWMFIGTGILGFFMVNNTYFKAIEKLGVSVSSVLLYTAPIFVTILSAIIFKEKLTHKKLVALVLSVLGSFFVSGALSSGQQTFSAFGILFGVLSGVSYALYSVFTVFALRKYSALTIALYTFLFSAVASFFTVDISRTASMLNDFPVILWTIGLGVFSTAIPTMLYSESLKKLEASKASIIATLEPVVASIIGITVFSENCDFFTVLGVSLVVTATVTLNLKTKVIKHSI